MGKIGSKNTKPELIVRKFLHKNGYRFRLHRKDLPGSPDIVFVSRKKVIFVHGCFWHRHKGCKMTTSPNTHVNFWKTKFEANLRRDSKNIILFRQLGWKTMVVWGCEVRHIDMLARKILRFLK